MAGMAEKRLAEQGIVLPSPTAPIANYLPFVRTGRLIAVSGQLCLDANGLLLARGLFPGDFDLAAGAAAARQCAINLLAQVRAAVGDLDQVTRVVRLGGFIATGGPFADGARIMNGASDLMVSVFGECGRHARTTVGVSALPMDAGVEVDGLFEVL